MDPELEQLLFLIALLCFSGLSTVALNYGIHRILPKRSMLAHWLTCVAIVPAVMVSFGVYQFYAIADGYCAPVDGFAIMCPDISVVKMEIAFLWTLQIPIAYLCVSIPVTAWFVTVRMKT